MSELDRLLAAASDAEPDPLSAPETEALIESVRRRAEQTPLARLLAEAREAEPDPLAERELRSTVEHAAVTGRARHRRWTRRRVMLASAVAATVAAAAITLIVPPPVDPVSERAPLWAVSEPTNLDLPTGDRLVAASGARFHVELPDPRIRRVRLGDGSMLFDVRPLEQGSFSVSTPIARVDVLGTVFSVRANERATTVWVYEGTVRVRGPDGAHVVEAGAVLHLGAGDAGTDALASAGHEAAARRAGDGPIASSSPPMPLAPSSDRPVSDLVDVAAPRPSPTIHAHAARTIEEPSATPVEPASATPAEVRALIASGDAARALDAATLAIERGETDPWCLLEGDALRVLGRSEEAAIAYQRAARVLPPPRRQQAGFLEARLRMSELDDAAGALRALRAADVSTRDSVLRERAMVLEVQILGRVGRHAEAAAIATDYLRDYPDGPDADVMRASAAR